jgi:hypothetical protein
MDQERLTFLPLFFFFNFDFPKICGLGKNEVVGEAFPNDD